MPHEAPVHEVTISPFWMDKHEVTVAEFEKFVKETSYVTEGEKIGWSGVFSVSEGNWTKCDKVSWRNPDCGDKNRIRTNLYHKFLGAMQTLTQNGRTNAFRPKPNLNSRLAAVWFKTNTHGEMSFAQTGNPSRIGGKELSRSTI